MTSSTNSLTIALIAFVAMAAAFFGLLTHTARQSQQRASTTTRSKLNRLMHELLQHGITLRLMPDHEYIVALDKNFCVLTAAPDAITAAEKALTLARLDMAIQSQRPSQGQSRGRS